MLLVIIRRFLRCLTNSAATASMVVPMLINSEALSGMVEAINRAMAFFPAADGCAAPALPLRLKRRPKMRRHDSV